MFLEDIVKGVSLENENTEFKRILDEGKSEKTGKSVEINWLKTFVAFANSNGGTIYVGIDDSTHQIISLEREDVDKTYQRIRRLLRERIEPGIVFDFNPIPVENKNSTRYIIKITVHPSSVLPVTLHIDNLLGIYVRHYSSTELASPSEIKDMVLLSDSNPFDSTLTDRKFNC